MFEVAADLGEKLHANTNALRDLRSRRPIRYPIMGANTTPATNVPNPFLVTCGAGFAPAPGRTYQIEEWGIYGTDDHSPVLSGTGLTVQGTGVVTNPGASTIIASLSAANLLLAAPIGTLWAITWSVGLQGTVTAADANNMRLLMPIATTQMNAIYPGVVGQFGQPNINLQPASGNNITVATIAASSGAAAIYTAQIVATPLIAPLVFSSGTTPAAVPAAFAVVYAGPGAGQESPDDLASIVSGQNGGPSVDVPYHTSVGDSRIWMKENDIFYAWVYNAPANQQFVLVANVADYVVDAREAVTIP